MPPKPTPTPKTPDPGTPQPMPTQDQQVPFFTKLLALRNEANVARLRSETSNEDVIGTLIAELTIKEKIIGLLKQKIEKIDKMYKELVDKEANKNLPGRPVTPKELKKGDKKDDTPVPIPKEGPKPPPVSPVQINKPEPEPPIPTP